MTFKKRFWAYLTRRDMLRTAITAVVFFPIAVAIGLIEVTPAMTMGGLMFLQFYAMPSLFYALARIDPTVDRLDDYFMIDASWPLALVHIFWLPLVLTGWLLSHGNMPVWLTIILICWPSILIFNRIKLREEFRAKSKIQQ